MSIILNYAEGTDLSKPINIISLNNTDELKDFLSALRLSRENRTSNTVYVWTSDHSHDDNEDSESETKEIVITEDIVLIESIVRRVFDYSDCEVYLQEYSTYEDAYAVALDMREGNPLCYN
jgi:predicted AlkP superfamily pyrophosphatase or phosphodiesterase